MFSTCVPRRQNTCRDSAGRFGAFAGSVRMFSCRVPRPKTARGPSARAFGGTRIESRDRNWRFPRSAARENRSPNFPGGPRETSRHAALTARAFVGRRHHRRPRPPQPKIFAAGKKPDGRQGEQPGADHSRSLTRSGKRGAPSRKPDSLFLRRRLALSRTPKQMRLRVVKRRGADWQSAVSRAGSPQPARTFPSWPPSSRARADCQSAKQQTASLRYKVHIRLRKLGSTSVPGIT